MKIFKNKKFYLIGLAVVLAGLFFSINASPASAACGENRAQSSISSFLNPLASLVEKIVKDFGYSVSLAAAPDPDFCGSDSVGCSGELATASITWVAAPGYVSGWGPLAFYCLSFDATVGGNPDAYPQWSFYYTPKCGPDYGPYYTNNAAIGSLANNTLHNWYIGAWYYWDQEWERGYLTGYYRWQVMNGGNPGGSFTTPNCAPPPAPTVTLTANGVRPQIKIAEGWSVNLDWTSYNADSCTGSVSTLNGQLDGASGWNGAKPTSDSSADYTYTLTDENIYTFSIQCTGPNGSAQSSVIVDVVRPILTLERGSQTCLAVNLSWSWNDPFFNNEYTQYRVLRRSEDGRVFSQRAVVNAPTMTYQDKDTFISDKTYYYQIEALKAGSSSVFSNIIQTVPCPKLPSWEEIRPR